ncbi:Diaminopimelate epimerase [Geobacillus sp. BCO2]|nr:Diaminopimelate epimerase [Geobacillus sp. BCO2]
MRHPLQYMMKKRGIFHCAQEMPPLYMRSAKNVQEGVMCVLFSFTKMHGLGNSYIYVDLFREALPEEELPAIARSVADVHTGIGSDGLILICPSEKAPLKMRILTATARKGKTAATVCAAWRNTRTSTASSATAPF